MKLLLRVATLSLFVAGAAGCSGDSNGPSVTGSVTANINTTPFTASTAVQATYAANVLAVGGTGNGTQILITIPNVTTTGQFNIGLGQAGVAVVTVGTDSWTTSLTGGTGSVTLTTLTSSHAVGDFFFTAQAGSAGATGTKDVASGHFDVTF